MPLPCFIDFEASGLDPDSYPVEVAWSTLDGAVDSCLIRPAAHWTHWDPNAEDLHGISRAVLERDGLPVEVAARRLYKALSEVGVAYSDASAFDEFWCETLFETSGQRSSFRIASALEVFTGCTFSELDRYREAAYRTVGGQRHRARTDVLVLVECYGMVAGHGRQ